MQLSPNQLEALRQIAAGRFYPDFLREDDGWHARWRVLALEAGDESAALDGWVDEYVRRSAVSPLTEDAENERHATLHDAWLMALKSRTGLVNWDEAECAEFAAEVREWNGSAAEDIKSRRQLIFDFSSAGGFSLAVTRPQGRRQLRALGMAAQIWRALGGLRNAGEHLQMPLTPSEAEDFLRRGARDLREAGFVVRGVELQAEITAAAELKAPEKPTGPATATLTVRVAGEPVTAAEIRFLLDQGTTLVFFRERWIEVDRGILKAALRALERCGPKVRTPLGFALGLGHIGPLELTEVKSHGWVRGLVNELRSQGAAAHLGNALIAPKLSPIFSGQLRDYQLRGVGWLKFMMDHGFGALLADDMGLGKTIETIAAICELEGPLLVVAPLTLLTNWQRELKRFAPSLSVYVHQGDDRHVGCGFVPAVKAAKVVLTSYNLLVKDYSEFSTVEWQALVLDEAQAIKNPDTRVARAVCALRPPRRIALTGTPIENSLRDLWSIEEFLNPGFLGERKDFERRFVRPPAVAGNDHGSMRLKRALEPLVLRRLKTEPGIAAELGPKRLIKEYCELGAAARREYETALAEFRGSEPQQGEVFALLTRLKLICDGEGKLAHLAELVAEITASGESVLVFTQYVKVGFVIQARLKSDCGLRAPFLHGGLSVRQREAAIRDFNTRGGAFVLSLKAGGFGLNLTRATHVIHFDRWWNPAVENQATDRAHRIGQTQTVFVHEFITAGTLEEHIDELLERKESLSSILAGGEGFWEAVALDAAEVNS